MASFSAKQGRWIAVGIIMACVLAVLGWLVRSNMKNELPQLNDYQAWDASAVEAFSRLPIQNGGRIKPISTYANFEMLKIRGDRKIAYLGKAGKGKITPIEWLMDALFRPQVAMELPSFRVDNSEVLTEIGLKAKGKRDRYSYKELEAGRDKLFDLAQKYGKIQKEKRLPVQEQTVNLASNVREFENVASYFAFARFGVILRGTDPHAGDQRANLSAMMQTASLLNQQVKHFKDQKQPVPDRLQELLGQSTDAATYAKFDLRILPPKNATDKNWLTAGDVIETAMAGKSVDLSADVKEIESMERMIQLSQTDQGKFITELKSWVNALSVRAKAHGGCESIPLENYYYRKPLFVYALVYFLMGVMAVLAMWVLSAPKSKKITHWKERLHPQRLATAAVWLFSLLGAGYGVAAIVIRCLIMKRAPIGNLYDTIIFIGTSIVILALLVEWMTKRRVALSLAPISGALLVILARRFELGDAKDHMDPLVAVLNSNFWLTIHVITISLGYCAGLFSSILSMAYVLIRGFNLDNSDKDLRRSLTRAAYGCLCLTLFLSLIGTVLGGVWANYSWGRFWGWDPKENGALLIVLWALAVLHARLGGIIREWGLHLCMIATAAIVAFSWWHVNFLNTGLHNYGFTAGKDAIFTFYYVIIGFLAFGGACKVMESMWKDDAPSRH